MNTASEAKRFRLAVRLSLKFLSAAQIAGALFHTNG